MKIQKSLDYKLPKQVWFDYYRQAAQLNLTILTVRIWRQGSLSKQFGKKHTVGTEGNNCLLRHRLKREVRKTCCFSKNSTITLRRSIWFSFISIMIMFDASILFDTPPYLLIENYINCTISKLGSNKAKHKKGDRELIIASVLALAFKIASYRSLLEFHLSP